MPDTDHRKKSSSACSVVSIRGVDDRLCYSMDLKPTALPNKGPNTSEGRMPAEARNQSRSWTVDRSSPARHRWH
uniref:Uncharacterized protein n=1 Tax=Ditylenchus dipsaci TaxID=166011 RepID=A0A915ERW0_9BILA